MNPSRATRLLQFLRALRPPARWHVAVLLLLGILIGLSALTFHVSRASSYLGDNPATCVNCHIMAPQYATWSKSSHANVATCNDCHVPHGNPLMKYGFKAYDGSRHAFMFTFRMEPQVIRIHAPGAFVVQQNCVRCHSDLLQSTAALAGTAHGDGRKCWDCHRETPHGRVSSLSAVAHAQVPKPDPVQMPEWLTEFVEKTPAAARESAPSSETPNP